MKPLIPILAFVGVLSVAFGYAKAYVGPFFVVMLHNAGYTFEQITSVQVSLAVFWMVAGWAGVIAVAFVSYHHGAGYKLTKLSGFALVILAYFAEVLGNLLGTAIYQIQTLEYPVLLAMVFEILTSHSYVYVCLIGVLAANYVREQRQQRTSTYQ